MDDQGDTIAAIATPAGTGGIGIVRVSGAAALPIAETITSVKPRPGIARYCAFRDGEERLIDRGILLCFYAPASYTGEDIVEFQGHGGRAVLELLLAECLRQGARLARPGEFTERAFHNNKLDLLQAEAVADLINSSSRESARSAMRSLEGEFSRSIDVLVDELAQLRVFVESALDFPDEEIDFLAESKVRERLSRLLERTVNILGQAETGRIMREGARLCILGAPNVGKSSLLNRLAGTERAIVSAIPGTTRDTLDDRIVLEGIPLELVDTAGIRETEDEIELEGISRAQRSAKQADLVLLVRDNDLGFDENIEKHLLEDVPCIIVNNKIDLRRGLPKVENAEEHRKQVYLSAKTGEGVAGLVKLITRTLNPGVAVENALPGRLRHIRALENTRSQLEKALNSLAETIPAGELLAEDILQAQHALETITGKSSPDDLLAGIFSSFCIGK